MLVAGVEHDGQVAATQQVRDLASVLKDPGVAGRLKQMDLRLKDEAPPVGRTTRGANRRCTYGSSS